MTGKRSSRREFLASAASAATASALLPAPALAQAAPRVVVIGGGFAGATAARALKQADPRIAVTLVEASRTFTACPFSNLVIGGLRELKQQQFGYDKVAADGIEIAFATATRVDRAGAHASRSRAAPRLPTTGWWWRPASTSAGTACPATPRPPPRRCRTPGRPASRRCCCAASSKPWRTAASSSCRRRPIRSAARPAPTSAPA